MRPKAATATSFADIELTSFLDDKDFGVACGPHDPPDRVFLTWKPAARAGEAVAGTAVALEFVPKTYVP